MLEARSGKIGVAGRVGVGSVMAIAVLVGVGVIGVGPARAEGDVDLTFSQAAGKKPGSIFGFKAPTIVVDSGKKGIDAKQAEDIKHAGDAKPAGDVKAAGLSALEGADVVKVFEQPPMPKAAPVVAVKATPLPPLAMAVVDKANSKIGGQQGGVGQGAAVTRPAAPVEVAAAAVGGGSGAVAGDGGCAVGSNGAACGGGVPKKDEVEQSGAGGAAAPVTAVVGGVKSVEGGNPVEVAGPAAVGSGVAGAKSVTSSDGVAGAGGGGSAAAGSPQTVAAVEVVKADSVPAAVGEAGGLGFWGWVGVVGTGLLCAGSVVVGAIWLRRRLGERGLPVEAETVDGDVVDAAAGFDDEGVTLAPVAELPPWLLGGGVVVALPRPVAVGREPAWMVSGQHRASMVAAGRGGR